MHKIKLFSLVILLAAIATGCKYEEGPLVSFVPKTERVTNTWVVSGATIDGQADSMDDFKSITFYKEGDLSITFVAFGSDVVYSGTWTFNSKKTSLLLTSDDDATGFFEYNRTWDILKLKEDELHVTWSEDDGSGGTHVYDVVFAPAVP